MSRPKRRARVLVPASSWVALAVLALVTQPAPPAPAQGGAGAEADLVWPLGLNGYEPRILYNTAGQWVDVDGPKWHQGIDLGAKPLEYVFAVEDGTVVATDLVEDPADQFQCVVVSRG